MDKMKYLLMCEQMGQEPKEEEIPPDFNDFPNEVHIAFEIFNSLPDNYTGGMSSVYCGKDYSALNTFFDLYSVYAEDRLEVFRIINHLDSRARQKAIKDAEAAARKAKAK